MAGLTEGGVVVYIKWLRNLYFGLAVIHGVICIVNLYWAQYWQVLSFAGTGLAWGALGICAMLLNQMSIQQAVEILNAYSQRVYR